MHQILSIEQFQEIKNKGIGFIAITDRYLRKNCVHHPNCSSIQDSNFVQKAITSNCKNGKYIYVDHQLQGLDISSKMKLCGTCFS
ncbi:hypothetical protein A8990_13657 [Paenibacillus taihuensis]|uniref:Uncharacterized protein n=1 Tax=Paenibacillus taihuensis TaxID=1156355 RepID=A0A3D9QVU0_9BACL|nr:hypothetical protein A8990_13657 [Paenibacillus taihuensis]